MSWVYPVTVDDDAGSDRPKNYLFFGHHTQRIQASLYSEEVGELACPNQLRQLVHVAHRFARSGL